MTLVKRILNCTAIIVLYGFIGLTILGCPPGTAIERSDIKVIFTEASSSISDESGKLSEDARFLLSGLEGEQDKCKHAFILDPRLIRPDLGIDTSIITKIEKSPVAATTSIRDFKLVKQNLEELIISNRFLKKPASKIQSDSLFNRYVLSEVVQDSLLVFMDKKALDSLKVNGKRYKVLTNSNEVRSKILSVLCQNPKASFALLINPPVETSLPPEPPKGTVVVHNGHSKSNGGSKEVTSTVIRTVIKRQSSNITGDLTIIKGSEGCDVCTHYYSATDNLGKTHEVREKNSTFCCPCDKIVEIKGRTYRMDCGGGGGNRLALVE